MRKHAYIRKVWIPATLARLLRSWKDSQDKLKEILGDENYDNNLVIALENGRPCEDRVIGNAFNRLKKKADLPDVVFHSLRHSSTTYKLKLRGVEQSLRSESVQQPGMDAVQLLLQLQANSELAAVLKGLLNTNLFG